MHTILEIYGSIKNRGVNIGYTSPNTAYTLQTNDLVLWDIAPYGRRASYMLGTLGETAKE